MSRKNNSRPRTTASLSILCWRGALFLLLVAGYPQSSHAQFWGAGIPYESFEYCDFARSADEAIDGCTAYMTSPRNWNDPYSQTARRYSAFIKRGKAFNEKSDFDRAIADFNQALLINPAWIEAHYNLAVTYSNKGDRDKAYEYIGRAFSIKQNDLSAIFVRGQIHERFSNKPAAIDDYKECLRLDSTAVNCKQRLERLGGSLPIVQPPVVSPQPPQLRHQPPQRQRYEPPQRERYRSPSQRRGD